MDSVYLILSLLGGCLIGAIATKSYFSGTQGSTEEENLRRVKELEEELEKLKQVQLLAEERQRMLVEEREKQVKEHERIQLRLEEKLSETARLIQANSDLKERLAEGEKDREETQKRLTTEFENIAHKLLSKNSSAFAESNQKSMQEILNPLKEKISLFEKKVEDTYEKGLKDQNELKVELLKLNELNQRISKEANNLTQALKSDSKKQGNWGEVVLERVLERSGLTRGQEYEREVVEENSAGETIRPDVVVHLPDNKHIIIDSKVSLTAYERYVNSEKPEERSKAIKEHLISIRNHIKGLSEKHYASAKGLNSPDFVLLFVPIESSFSVAIQEDQELFNFAWEKKVVIVSPSTLLATLRTVASIWQQENQTRNAREIARLSGVMYDKLSGFLADLDKIKLNLDRATGSYEEVVKKLHTGRGNMLVTAQKIKDLGAKTSKSLPENWDSEENE